MKLRIDQLIAIVVLIVLVCYLLFKGEPNSNIKSELPTSTTTNQVDATGTKSLDEIYSIETFGLTRSSERLRYSLPGAWKPTNADLKSNDKYDKEHSQRNHAVIDGRATLIIDLYSKKDIKSISQSGANAQEVKAGNYNFWQWNNENRLYYGFDDPLDTGLTVVFSFDESANEKLVKTVVDSIVLNEPD